MSKLPSVIFASCHAAQPKHQFVNPEVIFEEAMRTLAQACVGNENPEFLVLNDYHVLDIVFSNQSFFWEDLQKALEAVGITHLVPEVPYGMGTTNLRTFVDAIRMTYPDWEPPSDVQTKGHFVMYRLKAA